MCERKWMIGGCLIACLLASCACGAFLPSGDWDVGTNWDIGHVPTTADGNVYAASDGAAEIQTVIIDSDVPAVAKLRFGHAKVELTGSLESANWSDVGRHKPCEINLSGSGSWQNNGILGISPSTTSKAVTFNISDNALMKVAGYAWLYGNGTRINISGDGAMEVNGLWFPLNSGDKLVPGNHDYEVNLIGNAQFRIWSSLAGGPWSEQTALDAIAAGFFTGSGLQVSTSPDNTWTIVSVPEPVTMLLLGLGGVSVIRRRRA